MRALSYLLFLLLTAFLFLRPAEMIPGLAGQPIYEVTILACTAFALPSLVGQLKASALKARPISLCVLGLLPAVALSQVSHGQLGLAWGSTFAFFKVALSYFLLVAIIDTPARLRFFLGWLALLVLGVTGMALLQYHGLIDNPALAQVADWKVDPSSGELAGTYTRLCGPGIFNNPNDLARILVVGMTIALYRLGDPDQPLLKPVWVGLLGTFGYALTLTYSRGGFIAFVVSLVVLFYARFRGWKGALLGALALPVVLVLFGGRQTNITTSEGTGQQRIRLWSDGLSAMRESPLFGIGMDEYPKIASKLGAHNSFVHCYVELGFVGGTLFLAAVYLALSMTYRLGPLQRRGAPPTLQRLRPCILAIVAGYAAGMLSSSRCYAIPTYLLVGLAVIYLRLVAAAAPTRELRLSGRLVGRALLVSAVVLVAFHAYVRVAVQWGPR